MGMFDFLNTPSQQQAQTVPVMPTGQIPLANANPIAATQATENPNFFASMQNKLETDPNLKTALLVAGLNMMNGAAPGQSQFGAIGQGALQGLGYYTDKNAADAKLGLETKRTNSEVAGRDAATEGTVIDNNSREEKNREGIRNTVAQTDAAKSSTVGSGLRNELLEKTLNTQIQLKQLEWQEAQTAVERNKIKLETEQLFAGFEQTLAPETLKAKRATLAATMFAPAQAKADVNVKNAQANNLNTNAAQTVAETGIIEQSAEDLKNLTPEERKQKILNPSGGSIGQQTLVNNATANWEILNPEPKDQAGKDLWRQKRAAFQLDFQSQAKTNRASILQTLLVNATDPNEIAAYTEELRGLLNGQQGQVGTGTVNAEPPAANAKAEYDAAIAAAKGDAKKIKAINDRAKQLGVIK